MNKEFKLSFRWSCDQGIEIPEQHEDALEEDAKERAFEMLRQGYSSGELCTYVRYGKDEVPEEDEEEGLSYSGWWSFEEI